MNCDLAHYKVLCLSSKYWIISPEQVLLLIVYGIGFPIFLPVLKKDDLIRLSKFEELP